MNFDLIVIGSGPGGYVAAIRASQLGMNVAVVERAELGGICLNWGCIPTKALLKSAQVLNYLKHTADYGITLEGNAKPDFEAVIKRSRNVAENMSKGIQFLFKKNNITVLQGSGKVLDAGKVEVIDNSDVAAVYEAKNIIIATGARSRQLPNLTQDGKKIIGYREAMNLPKLPASMVVVGSGAIGSEFAQFYNAMGTKVFIVEVLPNLVPLEDEEASKQLERAFKKSGIKVYTDSMVQDVDASGELCKVKVKTKKGEEIIEAEIVFSAVGIATNIEGLGLEEAGIITDKGKIVVDDYYKTNIEGIYAIGDIVHGPALAHVASREGIICVEKIAGHHPKKMDYTNIPGCTYTTPEIASVGLSEKIAVEKGYEIKVGRFPFTASGKASASGNKEGFVKVIFDAKTDLCLGAHLVGDNVTEMISELVVIRQMKIKASEIIESVHPHPTMSEAVMEAVAAAYGEAVHV